MNQAKTLAIVAEIENEQTGAVTEYHVPISQTHDYQMGGVSTTFASYVSKKAYQNGKQPVGYITKMVSIEPSAINEQALQAIITQENDELFGGQISKA